MLAVAHVHNIIPALLILFVTGVFNVFFNGSIITWIQRSTPASMRPRVLTLRGLVLGIGGGIGALGSGFIAHIFGLVPAFTVVSALIFLGVLSALRLKRFQPDIS
jgi:nitrate/nitrite transporter NarK